MEVWPVGADHADAVFGGLAVAVVWWRGVSAGVVSGVSNFDVAKY